MNEIKACERHIDTIHAYTVDRANFTVLKIISAETNCENLTYPAMINE